MKTVSHVVAQSILMAAALKPSNLFQGNKLIFSAKHRTTYFPPKKRNSKKECMRRVKQGLVGTCYVHGAQYAS